MNQSFIYQVFFTCGISLDSLPSPTRFPKPRINAIVNQTVTVLEAHTRILISPVLWNEY